MSATAGAERASEMAAHATDNFHPDLPQVPHLLARAQVEALAAIATAVDRLASAVEAAANR